MKYQLDISLKNSFLTRLGNNNPKYNKNALVIKIDLAIIIVNSVR